MPSAAAPTAAPASAWAAASASTTPPAPSPFPSAPSTSTSRAAPASTASPCAWASESPAGCPAYATARLTAHADAHLDASFMHRLTGCQVDRRTPLRRLITDPRAPQPDAHRVRSQTVHRGSYSLLPTGRLTTHYLDPSSRARAVRLSNWIPRPDLVAT